MNGDPTKDLDDLLQHRVRLGTCVLLADSTALSFSRLKELLAETDGNLGAHLAKLEGAGYVTVTKEFQDRKPVTWYRLSKRGKAALGAHVAALEKLILRAKGVDQLP
jgi:DNA-binding transcriptional ArsR family regulator